MPNAKGYCGRPAFFNALKSGDWRKVMGELSKFSAHYGYLKLISSCNSINPFDKGAVEAFWIGNRLLDNVQRNGIADLLREFQSDGLISKRRADSLIENMPEGAVPHHSFHVLYVNSLSGVIRGNIGKLDRCRVGWGKVVAVNEGSADVLYRPLCGGRGNYFLGSEVEKRVLTSHRSYSPLRLGLAVGDRVTFHWDFAVQKIGRGEAAQLKKYTEKNIRAVNSCSD